MRAVLDALSGATSVVLTTHINADGDGAGSEVALAGFLRARGTAAWIVNPTPYPDSFRFLLSDPTWVVDAGDEAARRRCREADAAVVLDTGEQSRIGRVSPLIEDLPLIVVDHHQPGSGALDGVVFQDATASATGELVYEIIEAAGGPWSKGAAEALYVAILTDTGGFRFSNTSARCFEIASALVGHGADPAGLHRRVYGRFPKRRYDLLQASLRTLTVHEGGQVAWMTVPDEAFRRLGAIAEDLEGFVDVPRSIEGVEVALLFRTTGDGRTKVSFRSAGDADVNAIASRFGGGGHVKAAGALVDDRVDEAVPRVVAQVVSSLTS